MLLVMSTIVLYGIVVLGNVTIMFLLAMTSDEGDPRAALECSS